MKTINTKTANYLCPACSAAHGKLHRFTLYEAWFDALLGSREMVRVCCPECRTVVDRGPHLQRSGIYKGCLDLDKLPRRGANLLLEAERRRAKELARREGVLHRRYHSPDMVALKRSVTPDPKKPGMRDGLFFYDYDNKKGERCLEVCVRRNVTGILVQANTGISKDEATLLRDFLQDFINGYERRRV